MDLDWILVGSWLDLDCILVDFGGFGCILGGSWVDLGGS